MVAAGRAAAGLIEDEMTPPTARKVNPVHPRRKAQRQISSALEVVGLMREAVEHLAAIRAMMETAQAAQAPSAPIDNNNDAPPELIDRTDLLMVKQAAGIAGRDEKTIRRWHGDFEIGIVIGGTFFIRKSKLLAHLAHTKRCAE
jgi:hypothetical protein